MSFQDADSMLLCGGVPAIIHSLKGSDSLRVAGNVSMNLCLLSLLGADPSLDDSLDLTSVAKINFSCMDVPAVFLLPFQWMSLS